MTLTVRLFARVRELAGTDIVRIDLPVESSVSNLRVALAKEWPPIALLLARSAVAVNSEYVADDHRINPGDEIALIPPVSGGAG
jgi:molybdopterin converting factor subunit 1